MHSGIIQISREGNATAPQDSHGKLFYFESLSSFSPVLLLKYFWNFVMVQLNVKFWFNCLDAFVACKHFKPSLQRRANCVFSKLLSLSLLIIIVDPFYQYHDLVSFFLKLWRLLNVFDSNTRHCPQLAFSEIPWHKVYVCVCMYCIYGCSCEECI